MGPDDQPDLDLPFDDGPGPDDDTLSPVRDLLDTDGGPLVPDHAGPGDPAGEASGIPDISSLVEEMVPAEPVEDLDPIAREPETAESVDPDVAEPVDPAPVSLESDVPVDPADAAPATATPEPRDRGIDLSLDRFTPDGDPGDGDADPGRVTEPSDAPADEVVLPMPEPYALEFPVPEGNAELSAGVIAAALVLLGTSAQALRRLRRATPPDLAAHLDALGIDARVEHLDLTGLDELLAQGHTVLLSTDGSAGVDADAVLQLEHLDRVSGRLGVIDGRGRRRTLDLARFEDAWADSAHQVVQASGLEGGVALVPVVVRPDDLVNDR